MSTARPMDLADLQRATAALLRIDQAGRLADLQDEMTAERATPAARKRTYRGRSSARSSW